MSHGIGLISSFLTVCVIVVPRVGCTTDMNVHELQYVSDHLTTPECHKLMTALHIQSYEIKADKLEGLKTDLTCIELMVQWDEADSVNQTFHFLTHRLRQLGHKEVADEISKWVYHAKSDTLQRLFLDDPFKKMIHKNSPLLDTKSNSKEKAKKTDDDSDGPFDSYIKMFIITGVICAAIIALLILKRVCAAVCGIVAPVICPAQVLDYCDKKWNNIKGCCKVFKKNTNRHLLGVGFKKSGRRTVV